MALPQRCGFAKPGVSRLSTRDRPVTEVEHPMGTRPNQASWSIKVIHSSRFRSAVLFVVLFSLLPNVAFAWTSNAPDLLASANSEAADFIIGPQVPMTNSWFDSVEIEHARTHGQACPDTPPTDLTALNSFVLLQYYDLPLTEYVVY